MLPAKKYAARLMKADNFVLSEHNAADDFLRHHALEHALHLWEAYSQGKRGEEITETYNQLRVQLTKLFEENSGGEKEGYQIALSLMNDSPSNPLQEVFFPKTKK